MVILSPSDKANISAMAPDATRYCAYPAGMTPASAEEWMRSRKARLIIAGHYREFRTLCTIMSWGPGDAVYIWHEHELEGIEPGTLLLWGNWSRRTHQHDFDFERLADLGWTLKTLDHDGDVRAE